MQNKTFFTNYIYFRFDLEGLPWACIYLITTFFYVNNFCDGQTEVSAAITLQKSIWYADLLLKKHFVLLSTLKTDVLHHFCLFVEIIILFFLGFFEKKVLNNSINLNFLFVCNYVILHTHTHVYYTHIIYIYIDIDIDNVCVYTHTLPFKRCLMFFNIIYFSDSNQNFHLPFCQSAESHNPSEIIPICWFIINAVLFSFLFIKESWTKFQFPKNIKQKNCFQHW